MPSCNISKQSFLIDFKIHREGSIATQLGTHPSHHYLGLVVPTSSQPHVHRTSPSARQGRSLPILSAQGGHQSWGTTERWWLSRGSAGVLDFSRHSSRYGQLEADLQVVHPKQGGTAVCLWHCWVNLRISVVFFIICGETVTFLLCCLLTFGIIII